MRRMTIGGLRYLPLCNKKGVDVVTLDVLPKLAILPN